MSEEKGMRPIWFFVGLLFVTLGVVITGTGIYYLIVPADSSTVLQHLHPNIWWGGTMLVFGAVMLWLSKDMRIK